MKKILFLVVLTLVLGSCTSSDSKSSEKNSSKEENNLSKYVEYKEGKCQFEVTKDVTAKCGWLEVPQDWDDPENSKTIKLHAAYVTNDSTPEDATPLVYLEGGPGGDSLTFFDESYISWRGIVNKQPVIFFNQRGNEYSKPDLECEEYNKYVLDSLNVALGETKENQETINKLQECANRLKTEGVVFENYNSVESAHDVEALRIGLGIDSWNVLGVSYGTRLAQTYMKEHPEKIDAVILDSVMSVTPEKLTLVPQTAEDSFDLLFKTCAERKSCADVYPDLEAQFNKLYDQLQKNPAQIKATNPLNQEETYDVRIDGDDFVSIAFQMMYTPNYFFILPAMISTALEGNYSYMSIIAGAVIAVIESLSIGSYQSIMCREVYGFITEDEFLAGKSDSEIINKSMGAEASDYKLQQDTCKLFNSGIAPKDVIEPTVSDIPTLLFAGGFDPITPLVNAEETSKTLKNSQVIEFPTLSHGVTVENKCTRLIANSFFKDPEAKLDTSCKDNLEEPKFLDLTLSA